MLKGALLKRGEVLLQHATRYLWLACCLLLAGPAGAAWIDVRSQSALGGRLPARFKIEIARVDGAGDLRRLLAVGETAAPNALEVADGTWRVVGIASGHWAAEQLVSVEGPNDRRELTLRFWPAAKLSGRIEPAPAAGAQVQVAFSMAPDQGQPTPPASSLRCPIREGAWECVVPAGSLDVEVELAGFAPQHRFGLRLQPGSRLDLGQLQLKKGPRSGVSSGRPRPPLSATREWGGAAVSLARR